MKELAQYMLSVTGAAMLTAIVGSLAGQGSMGALVKLLGGIFLALTMLRPLVTLELPDPARWFSEFSLEGQAFSEDGVAMADQTMADIITNRVEAYIQDKAALYQAPVMAEVTLDENGVPISVIIMGDVGPYARTRLAEMMETDLGIGKEAQQWQSNGPHG